MAGMPNREGKRMVREPYRVEGSTTHVDNHHEMVTTQKQERSNSNNSSPHLP